jgi:tripartite-type tricarboxylate transporter receptor subunit TctC
MKRLSTHLCGLGLVALSVMFGTTAMAQSATWSPVKPVRIISPGAPGAILDVAARQLAEKLSASLGQPVIIENKPGGGGVLAMQALARSPADGHTVGIASFVELVVNPSLYEKAGYDPLRDMVPVTVLYAGALMLVSNPSLSIDTLPDLIRVVKSRPGQIFYGSSGVARPPHIYMEQFKAATSIDLRHAPYKGTPPLMQAVLGGEIPLAMEGGSGFVPHIKAGKLKPLAVTGDRRLSALPDVPTFAELGVPGMTASWVGIVAPAGTPVEAVQRLNREFVQALESPDIRAAYDLAGRQVVANTPETMGKMMRDDIPKWRAIVKAAGIKAE